jgi:hypothetical protein
MEKLKKNQFYAYFIDVKKQTVTRVVINQKKFLQDCYSLIGTDIIERVYIELNNSLIVDEDGCLRPKLIPFKILINGEYRVFVGNAIIIGEDGDKFCEPTLPINRFRIKFYNHIDVNA